MFFMFAGFGLLWKMAFAVVVVVVVAAAAAATNHPIQQTNRQTKM